MNLHHFMFLPGWGRGDDNCKPDITNAAEHSAYQLSGDH